jgi:transcriptional regulator with XRE-family HTH domain
MKHERDHEIPEERIDAQEKLLVRATEALWAELNRRSIRKSELADKLGWSRPRVTQALAGPTNMTLRTLADLAWALECDVVLDVAPIEFNEGRVARIETPRLYGSTDYALAA